MSDEPPRPTTDDRNAWGDDISDGRKAELEQRLQAWEREADHGERNGPFSGVLLRGSDVSWLAEQSGRGVDDSVPNLRLEGANLFRADLRGASLGKARLESVTLIGAHLEGA